VKLFPFAVWGSIPVFDSKFVGLADLGKFLPVFFVYVFGAKCFSLIVVSDVFGLFSKGSLVRELLHI
jgi:hypothetical protein